MRQARDLLTLNSAEQSLILAEINQHLADKTPEERVQWSLEFLPKQAALSSSFGVQSAAMLHLLTTAMPDIPIILADTGYLFPETYQFIDLLTERLNLNLQVYQPKLTAAWQEQRYGQLWTQGEAGIKRYNEINKVEPMIRALKSLDVGCWFSGLRRSQSSSRESKPIVELSRGVVKVYPIIDWNNQQLHRYLKAHDLPYHPLWEQGYVSIGDHHSTRKLESGMTEEETRFFGLTRECGLHLDGYAEGI